MPPAGRRRASRVIGRILPHLRQYVRVRTTLADAEALGKSVADLLDNDRACVIQLGWDGQIVGGERPCDRAASRKRRVVGPRRRAARRNAGGRRHASRPAGAGDTTLRSSRCKRLDDGEAVVAAAAARIARQAGGAPGAGPTVPARGSAHADCRPGGTGLASPPGLVGATLGLSPAETEIAVLLAQGRTTREIAATTGRGYSTVRTHLKHIFAKLGVSRQVEVAQQVWKLSNLPAPQV